MTEGLLTMLLACVVRWLTDMANTRVAWSDCAAEFRALHETKRTLEKEAPALRIDTDELVAEEANHQEQLWNAACVGALHCYVPNSGNLWWAIPVGIFVATLRPSWMLVIMASIIVYMWAIVCTLLQYYSHTRRLAVLKKIVARRRAQVNESLH